jgi:hypothetical protein
MESLTRIGRALVIVSALGLPAAALAEQPPANGKPAAAAKKDAKAKKVHKADKTGDKSAEHKMR